MSANTAQFDFTFTPGGRFDLIDVRRLMRLRFGNALAKFPRAAYLSYHTTGGFFEQGWCHRHDYDPESLKAYIREYQRLFPPGADYFHDQLHLRTELDDNQRPHEPLNADSHLTFIGCGLANCVTYENSQDAPVFFVDLDGEYRGRRRERKTTVVAFHRASKVLEKSFAVPVSGHAVDSINLKDSRVGLFEAIQDWLRQTGVGLGRVDVSLTEAEDGAGLTVNEYETLLMKHDLPEVLRNPVRFMAERGKHMLMDPRAIPGKAKNYAKYDMVLVLNRFLDSLGLQDSVVEKLLHPFLAFPAARYLRMKRSMSFLVSPDENEQATVVQGTYQSPILVQWQAPKAANRWVHVRLYKFE